MAKSKKRLTTPSFTPPRDATFNVPDFTPSKNAPKAQLPTTSAPTPSAKPTTKPTPKPFANPTVAPTPAPTQAPSVSSSAASSTSPWASKYQTSSTAPAAKPKAKPSASTPVTTSDVGVSYNQALASEPMVPASSNAPASTGSPLLDAITSAIVAAHPELQKVQDLIRSGQDAAALEALYATDYYKTYQGAKLANDTLKLTKPQAYNDTINNEWLPNLRSYALQQGLTISDADLTTIAKSAFDMGLTPGAAGTLALFQKKDEKTGQPYVTGILGGIASTTLQNLKTAAADYGVYFDSESAAKAVSLGTTTEQAQMDAIKSLSKGAFPAWSNQIDAGLTMKQIAAPYISAYSNILGVDAAGITMSDNLLKQGLQGTDPTKPGGMPLWEFEKAVRKDPRWATSKDAMDSLSNVGSTIARQWGLMS